MMDRIFYYIKHPKTALVCRVVVGAVLFYAGLLKLFDMASLADHIENFRILPLSLVDLFALLLPQNTAEFLVSEVNLSLVNLFAILLPPLEIITGLCLMTGYKTNGSLFIATALFVVFGIAVESAILRDLDIACGCFGTSDAELVGLKVLYRDMALLLATIPVWLTPKWLWALDSGCCMKRNDVIAHNPADIEE